MVPPSVAGHGQAAQHLKGLDPLLAQACPVQDLGGLCEVGIREKGLHAACLPRPARSLPVATSPRRRAIDKVVIRPAGLFAGRRPLSGW
jgi:hypothetical protein